jgi:release factor glutamine methyltransferase
MMFYYKDLVIDVKEGIYFPREDSVLLAEVISGKELSGKHVLEVGAGSGFLAILAAKKGANVTAVDVNSDAVEIAKKNAHRNNVKIDIAESDLFSNVNGEFDVIIFNPPYLPDKDEIEGKEIWADNGIIEKFANDVGMFLKSDGTVFILVSSLTDELAVRRFFIENGFSISAIAKKKVPWEELIVLEAKKDI